MKKVNDILIVQITDTHIVPEGKHWQGDTEAKTANRLELVIEHINNLSIRPDFVVHTGDIVDDGSIASYEHAKKLLDKLKAKYFLICGNHDNYNNLKHVFDGHEYLLDDSFSQYFIDLPNLRLVFFRYISF